MYSWDVVNEPFNDDGSFRQDVFFNAMGSGYIADGLRTARAADPSATLSLNDYDIKGENAKSNAMYGLVQSLLSRGVPINGAGLESHWTPGVFSGFSAATMFGQNYQPKPAFNAVVTAPGGCGGGGGGNGGGGSRTL